MEKLLRHIQEQEIIDLACDLVNVPSPTGHERAVGEFVFEWLTRHGIDAVLQELGGDRGVGVVRVHAPTEGRRDNNWVFVLLHCFRHFPDVLGLCSLRRVWQSACPR